ncbi:MAG TPA: FecR family protein [Candidatus Acidoferrales bacterium]|nr:FecR family protein [Candidatus Acidoferrales bacterium]
MFRNRIFLAVCAALVTSAMAMPSDLAMAQATAQHAGNISLILPQVQLTRGGQSMDVKPPTPVYWGDVVVTGRMARARVALDDGSVLNVGSDASLTVTKHDASQQQTQIDIAYGEVRSKVVHITKPAGSFQVHTPTGVAGVVGTDFYMAYQNSITRLIVYEGKVQLCNLAGTCVTVGAGQMSSIRGSDEAPDAPQTAPPSELMAAGNNTKVGGPTHANFINAHPVWFSVLVAAGLATPIAIADSTGRGSKTPPPGAAAPVPGRRR